LTKGLSSVPDLILPWGAVAMMVERALSAITVLHCVTRLSLSAILCKLQGKQKRHERGVFD
jgi:hypothetical protein